MGGTLTIAALIVSSLPGRSYSTFASFQKALEVDSFLRMKISPTGMRVELPFADLVVGLSRKLNKYSFLHCLGNCCKSRLWCCCLLVLSVLIISKCSPLGSKLIL